MPIFAMCVGNGNQENGGLSIELINITEWKRFDRVHDSINTWNERLLWAYYTFKYGLRL